MNKIIKIINSFLLVIVFLLSFSIFKNKNYDYSKYMPFLNGLTNYLNFATKIDSVSNTINFIKISKNKYYNDSYYAYSPYEGTVLEASDNMVIIKCINGYLAVFENLEKVDVFKYDVVNKNTKLGFFIDYFIFYFKKDGMRYEYEEIISNNW